MTFDLNKLVTLLLIVAGTIFLTFTGHLDSQACVALLGAALGYVFGNGHGVGESRRYAERAERAAARAAARGGEVAGGGQTVERTGVRDETQAAH